jgi:hypothetical protein
MEIEHKETGPAAAWMVVRTSCLPYPMIGFSLPIDRLRLPPVNRMLHEQARGRPFFYFENVARAPKETWSTISKNLHGIKPEFVDLKHLCATARKRGYCWKNWAHRLTP